MKIIAYFFQLLETLLNGCLKFSRNRATIVIGLFVCAFAVCLTGLQYLNVTISPIDLVESSVPSVERLKEFNKEFKIGNQSVLVIEPQTDLSEVELCAIRKWVSFQRLYNDEIKDVFSTFELREVKYQPSKSILNYPLVLNINCASHNETNDSYVHQERIKKSLAPPTLSDLSGNNIVVVFNIEADKHSRKGSLNVRALQKIKDHFQTNISNDLKGAIRSHWIGTADFEYYLNEGMERGKYLNLFFIVIILCFLRFLLGTWKSGVIYIGTLLIVAVIIYGLMGFFKSPIDILTSGIFLIIGIATLEDFIFVSRNPVTDDQGRINFGEMLIPSFLTSLTTVIGFGSLLFTDVDSIRRLGSWLAVGAILEWSVVFMLLPAMAAKFSFFGNWTKPRIEPARVRHKKQKFLPFLKVLLIVYPFAIAASFMFKFSSDPYEMLPNTHELKQSIAQIQRAHGWVGQISLLYNANLTSDEKAFIRAQLGDAEPELVIDSFEGSILKLTEGLPASIADLVKSDMQLSGFKDRYLSDVGHERTLVYSKSFDFDYLQRLQDWIAKICPARQCELIGSVLTYKDYASKIRNSLIQSFSLSVILVAILLFFVNLHYGVRKEFLKILAATFFGPAFMVIYIAISGTSVNFLTCVFAAILVGLAGDNTIQFILAGRKNGITSGLVPLKVSGISTGLIMAFFSLIYLGSYFEPSKKFGVLLFFGFLAGVFGDIFLMESLFLKKEKRHNE